MALAEPADSGTGAQHRVVPGHVRSLVLARRGCRGCLRARTRARRKAPESARRSDRRRRDRAWSTFGGLTADADDGAATAELDRRLSKRRRGALPGRRIGLRLPPDPSTSSRGLRSRRDDLLGPALGARAAQDAQLLARRLPLAGLEGRPSGGGAARAAARPLVVRAKGLERRAALTGGTARRAGSNLRPASRDDHLPELQPVEHCPGDWASARARRLAIVPCAAGGEPAAALRRKPRRPPGRLTSAR